MAINDNDNLVLDSY